MSASPSHRSSADPAEHVVTPVILCGGAGTRLWPLSTPSRPKPFANLVGGRSGIQDALERARAIRSGSRTIVIGAAANRALIEAESAARGESVDLILEPGGRGSAAAMAAAAVHVAETNPDAVLAVLSADHHVDDTGGFVATIQAAGRAAREGAIVVLGIQPTAPLSSFGYIRPDQSPDETKPVLAFVEKPDSETAARYVREGYLWNSGMFIVSARTLLAELEHLAPEILHHARRGMLQASRDGAAVALGRAFLEAPNQSIDYAVMERTTRARVVPARFGWADIGAWDAVWAASEKDSRGNVAPKDAVLIDSEGVLALVEGDVRLGVVGLRHAAVISTGEATLVCALDQAQAVKSISERMSARARIPFAELEPARTWFDHWMRTNALPLWWALGADHDGGGFHEGLTHEGRPASGRRRLRVQARQIFAYAIAVRAGWVGPWRAAVRHGLDYLQSHYRRGDGFYAAWFDPEDGTRSEGAPTYEQAFVLLAFAAAAGSCGDLASELADRALALKTALELRLEPGGVYREIGGHPFQANANMHVFEALLAWTALDPERWKGAADALGQFALERFLDPERGVVHELYDRGWRYLSGDTGRLIEPGHQYEWAVLLREWVSLGGDDGACCAARRLNEAGKKGVDPVRGVAVNSLSDEFAVLDGGARLWPQCERLRAAQIFGEDHQALEAISAIRRYATTPVVGAWRDKLSLNGAFVDEPAPASTLYHLVGAWRSLQKV